MESASPDSNVLGKELLVPVDCPQCGARGCVPWEHLDRGLRCRQCKGWFQVTCHRQALWRRPAHAFHCPRCGERGMLHLAGAEGACPGCTLPLFLGPDGKLRSAEKLAELEQQLREASEAARQAERNELQRSRTRRPTWPILAAAAAVALLLLAAVMFAGSRSTPSHRALQLTQDCLACRWDEASRFVGEDEFQLAEFAKWQILHFASIQDRVRPAGDRIKIVVETKRQSPDQMIVESIISSPVIGKRRLVQYWNREEDVWLFDATASLRDPQKQRSGPGRVTPLDGAITARANRASAR